MHPSTAAATVLLDELVRCGVREVVLCPGSRSAPLAYAALAAEQQGRLRLHVRVDERTAGFLALGLAKVSRRPAVVVTTSGTAVANLHPAVLEAHHAAVPLIVLSADRPASLRGTGANQTTQQPGIFAGAMRWEADLPAPVRATGQVAYWRSTADRAWAAAVGALSGWPGPAHLNLSLTEPLLPGPTSEEPDWPEELDQRPDDEPWSRLAPTPRVLEPGQHGGSSTQSPTRGRTLMVLGDLPDPAMAARALLVASHAGVPVLAEPFGSGSGETVLPHGPLVTRVQGLLDDHGPHRVVVVGRPTLSRDIGALLRHPGVEVHLVSPTPHWPDPGHRAVAVHSWAELATVLGEADPDWAQLWREAGGTVQDRLAPVLSGSWPSGPATAAVLLGELDERDVIVAGSSNSARDLDVAGPAGRAATPTVVGNRGLAGIDGTLSTAIGISLGARDRGGRVVALVGDLTFLHDLNGLLIGAGEPVGQVTVVVVNDDGGGIFRTLEYGEPGRLDGPGEADFARLFQTSTGADLGRLCAGLGVRHRAVTDAEQLRAALREPSSDRGHGQGRAAVSVVEVRVDAAQHRSIREQLHAAARG